MDEFNKRDYEQDAPTVQNYEPVPVPTSNRGFGLGVAVGAGVTFLVALLAAIVMLIAYRNRTPDTATAAASP